MYRFWVVGGHYRNTWFRDFAPGYREERYGPFFSYVEAKKEWQRQSWAHVDNCHVRYRIVEEAEAIAC